MSKSAHRPFGAPRLIFALVASAALAVLSPAGHAAGLPSTIEIIVPYGAGGTVDTVARLVADGLRSHLPGQPTLVIRNVPGGGATRGVSELSRAKNDGSVFGAFFSTGLAPAQVIAGAKTFDLTKLEYVGTILVDPFTLFVSKKSPFMSVADLKKAPRPPRVSILGVGSSAFYSALFAAREMGMPAQFITGFKSGPEAITAVMRGDADASGFTIGLTSQHGEDLRVLAILDDTRDKRLPDVPTAKELGYDVTFVNTMVMAAPPGTPAAARQAMVAGLQKLYQDKAYLERHAKTGFLPVYQGPEKARATVMRELADFAKNKELIQQVSTSLQYKP